MPAENPFVAKKAAAKAKPAAKPAGTPDTQSRKKAEAAHNRSNEVNGLSLITNVPRGVNGQPMVQIIMTAAELIPTGQYANVSVGPAQITAWVDHDRTVDPETPYFSDDQRATLAQALNELAEIVEGDVIAVQRNIVMESMQEQTSKA